MLESAVRTEVPEISIVVPAYNERARILGTLNAIRSHCERRGQSWEIVVSADGNDGSREAVHEWASGDPRLIVLGSPDRRGKGRGIRDGVAAARGRVIGFVDADDKTPIEEMDRLLPWLDTGFDVAIGSRGVAESVIERRQPRYRQLGSTAFGIGMHLVLGLWSIHDTQCGFKFFRGGIARDLFARQRIDGYMFDAEILHLAERSGYRIKEVGVRWRDDGDSRLDLLAGNWRNFRDILRIRFGRYEPTPLAAAADAVREERLSA
jgi:dolichyl-phosphate beta-glucosyltransferase